MLAYNTKKILVIYNIRYLLLVEHKIRPVKFVDGWGRKDLIHIMRRQSQGVNLSKLKFEQWFYNRVNHKDQMTIYSLFAGPLWPFDKKEKKTINSLMSLFPNLCNLFTMIYCCLAVFGAARWSPPMIMFLHFIPCGSFV